MKNHLSYSKKGNTKKCIMVLLLITFLFTPLLYSSLAFADYSFGAAVNVSNTDPDSSNDPRVVTEGSNVYVVWEDDNSFVPDIFFARSTNNGTSFDPFTNLSSTASGNSINQKIAVSGSNVYVVWQDSDSGNDEIFFERSTDGGTTFNGGIPGTPGTAVNLSSNAGSSNSPQIAVSGSNVYVVWQDTTFGTIDILLTASSDGGATFGITNNLSNNVATSDIPQIAAAGTNVFVVWRDFAAGNDEIFFERSTDAGITFNGGPYGSPGSPVNLSNTSDPSSMARIAATGNSAYVVWVDSPSANNEIFFRRSTDGGASFVAGTTNLSNTDPGTSVSPQIATMGNNIYVVWYDDVSGDNEIYFKSSDDGGASFSGVNNLSNTSPGDSISPQLAVTSTRVNVVWQDDDVIFSPSSNLYEVLSATGISSGVNVVFDASQYKLSSTAQISITSSGSNTNAALAETISPVTITSTSDPVGITRTFTETGLDTGIFSDSITFTSSASSSLGGVLHAAAGDTITATFSGQPGTANIFTRSVSFDLDSYLPTSTIVITVNDQNSNVNTAVEETIPVTITTTKQASTVYDFQETGSDTGIFVLPSDASIAAGLGTITASYLGASDSAIIQFGVGPGGSGGGLARPGLVLDFIAGGNGGFDNSPPSFTLNAASKINQDPLKPLIPHEGPAPFSINGNGFEISLYANTIVTNRIETGKSVNVTLTLYDNSDLQHVALYTDLHGNNDEIQNSDTYIIYDKGKPVTVVDPNHLFSDVEMSVSKNDSKYKVNYEITFAKSMEKSEIIIRVWDEKLNSADTKIFDAWEVIEPQNNEQIQTQTESPNVAKQKIEETKEIQNILASDIKDWAGYSQNSISDSEILNKIGIKADHIPSWFTKTAKWTIEGQVTVDEFVNAIRYMYEKQIIT